MRTGTAALAPENSKKIFDCGKIARSGPGAPTVSRSASDRGKAIFLFEHLYPHETVVEHLGTIINIQGLHGDDQKDVNRDDQPMEP